MSRHDPITDLPAPDEVRNALASILDSDIFRTSPQLAAFLRFVVEAALDGTGERIKGYTIGVEVLRRSADFDPLTDPIVRVEATRLRRAIERYYAGPGAGDPVLIELARGSYVPRFAYRAALNDAASSAPDIASLRPGNGMPVLLLRPFEVLAARDEKAFSGRALHEKMCDAFARFDTINIVDAEAQSDAGTASDYQLAGSVECRDDGTTSIRFRLLDTSDRTFVWARAFEQLNLGGNRAAAEDSIVTELAAVLVQPFGVIRANDRVRHLASAAGDPRYRAIVEASESFRSFDAAQHRRARLSLERLTAADPGFSVGFAYLAGIYFRSYQYGYAGEGSDRAILDRALEVVRRSVELKPESSRAYQIMFGVLFARHEVAAAFAAGDKAMALNSYDMTVLSDYGGRLVMIGEIERGMRMLSRAAEFGIVRPSWHHFYLFLGSYLRGDLTNTVHHANQITSDDYPLGLVARALAALKSGEPERASQLLERLKTVKPAWRENPRAELDKFFPVADLAGRIAADLADAGLAAA